VTAFVQVDLDALGDIDRLLSVSNR